MLRSRHREARHRIFGAVEFLNDSDPGDRVRPLEVDQMGGRSDTRRLKQEDGAVSSPTWLSFSALAVISTVPLVRRRPCSRSRAACIPGPPGSRRSPAGTEQGSSSALWSLWLQ